jgi:branched-chain amino acid transport system substrate-binding protein
MGRKGTILAVLACAVAVTGIAVTAASGAHRATPGITATEIKIGGTFPLTGIAAAYKSIPAAAKAYFDYVNDHGGVNGRKINFEILDDSYDPSKTVPLTQQLVEKDGVFAVYGSLGTAPVLATWDYLNSHKVPQALVTTGDSYWGFCAYRKCGTPAKKYPWTIGWQPDYPGESKLYGRYIAANLPNAKIGVLYQSDAYGKNYLAGLRVGLGVEKRANIVDAQTYDVQNPNVAQQILSLKSKGADTLVVFATPTATIGALVTATKLGWSPATFINNVSANRLYLLAATGLGASVDGVISTTYAASPTTQPNLPGMKLGKAIVDQYAPALSTTYAKGDATIVFGLASAWTFVYALQNSGKNPTRESLKNALHNMNTTKNPFVYPGIRIQTSAKDNFPIEQLRMTKWVGGGTGDWQAFGKLLDKVR